MTKDALKELFIDFSIEIKEELKGLGKQPVDPNTNYWNQRNTFFKENMEYENPWGILDYDQHFEEEEEETVEWHFPNVPLLTC